MEEFVTLNGLGKSVSIKPSYVVSVTVTEVPNPENPFMLNIKSKDKKFDCYLVFETKEKAEKEAYKILNK